MLLDTNVVSELIRKSPAAAVATWVSDFEGMGIGVVDPWTGA